MTISRLRWPDSTNSVSDVSGTIHRGSFEEFSIERFLRLLTAPGGEVDIVIQEPRLDRPAGSVLKHRRAYQRVRILNDHTFT